jgi:hypothetical protein
MGHDGAECGRVVPLELRVTGEQLRRYERRSEINVGRRDFIDT